MMGKKMVKILKKSRKRSRRICRGRREEEREIVAEVEERNMS
jgi:hypothetical protein